MENRFATRLRKLREYSGETRAELGSAINATVSAIRTWEDGRHNCSFDDLLRIARHYEVTTDYLLGNTDFDDPISAAREPEKLDIEDRMLLLRFEEFLLYRKKIKK